MVSEQEGFVQGAVLLVVALATVAAAVELAGHVVGSVVVPFVDFVAAATPVVVAVAAVERMANLECAVWALVDSWGRLLPRFVDSRHVRHSVKHQVQQEPVDSSAENPNPL